MPRDRKRTAHAALRGIDAEIAVRRAELAALDKARDVIARGAEETAGRCDVGTERSACGGAVHAAWCRACGHVARCCATHGAQRAATARLRHHEHQEHGGEWSRGAETQDTGAVLGGGEAMPVGGVPPSPADHGHRDGAPAPQQADGGEADDPRAEGD